MFAHFEGSLSPLTTAKHMESAKTCNPPPEQSGSGSRDAARFAVCLAAIINARQTAKRAASREPDPDCSGGGLQVLADSMCFAVVSGDKLPSKCANIQARIPFC